MGVNLKSQSFFRLQVLSFLFLTSCTSQFEVNPEAVFNLPSESQLTNLDGKALYNNNCASCHGAVASSTKMGRSQTQIVSSIQNIPQMSSLKSLSTAEIQAITQALQPVVLGTCAPSDVLSQQVRRLTRTQMYNTMVQTFGTFIKEADIPKLPDPNPRIGFASDPDILGMDPITMATYHLSVKDIVAKIIAENATVKNCQLSGSDACFASVIEDFGLKLWRRPLSPVEIKHLQDGQKAVAAQGGSRTLRLSLILSSLLLSPDYLYRTEIGTLDSGTSLYNLTPYEIASYLSFSILNTSPDAALLAAAQNGQLSTTGEIKAQIARLLKMPQWREGMTDFVADFIKVADVLTASKDKSLGVSSIHRSPLYNSAKATISDSYANTNSSIFAPFSTNDFYYSPATTAYFNLPGGGPHPTLIKFQANPAERHGILTHPAFLFSVSGEVSSGIVKRGIFTLEQLLCEHIGAPPDEVSPVTTLPAGFDASKVTSREVLHITHSSQTSCYACHQRIDPAGFGYENFDALGKFRMFEKSTVAINGAGSLTTQSGEMLKFTDSLDFVKSLVESKSFQACVEKKLFKFVTGQNYGEGAGVCESANFAKALEKKGRTFESVFDSLVELRSFRSRKPASK